MLAENNFYSKFALANNSVLIIEIFVLRNNKKLLVYGVMVTQLFLVQSFKVRVLVDQRVKRFKTLNFNDLNLF